MLSAGRLGPGLCWDTAGRAFWLWWGTSSWGTLACLGFWGPHGPWGLCRWHNTLAELQDSRWAHCVSDHGKVLLAHSKPRPHKPRRRWEEGQLATGSPGASWWATTPKRSAHGVQHPGSRAHPVPSQSCYWPLVCTCCPPQNPSLAPSSGPSCRGFPRVTAPLPTRGPRRRQSWAIQDPSTPACHPSAFAWIPMQFASRPYSLHRPQRAVIAPLGDQ